METETGNVQENRYDAENLRFELLENGKRTGFVYHNGELLHEEGGVGQDLNGQTSYHLGVGIDAFQRGQELSYYHRDEQLSTAFITGRDRELQNSYLYDAFGAELETNEQFPNRIRYTGQQYDELTEQYYLRARYYNPVLGRFMQEDVYQGDGLNLYAYCHNNPVMYSDPSGYGKKGVISCTTQPEMRDGGNNVGGQNVGEPLNRTEAFNTAKDRAGVPRSQQPTRQWQVGDDINMKGCDPANYRYDANPKTHGRYYEYDTPNGKRVVVDHTNDGNLHFHAGKPKGDSTSPTYDFKENRYQKIDGPDGDHHIYYQNS